MFSSIVYTDSQGSCFCQSGRVKFCQSGVAPFRTGPVLANQEGSCFANLEGYKLGGSCFYQSVRVSLEQISGRSGCLFDELIETGEVGFNRHVKL